ncbi:hypothetical protein SAM9427_36105 (plasmid) [Streptomyces sp. ETH9427]|nr:hypothetical protein SAM9427_36105 [Streptomyces sp. ETH9427]
MTSASGAHAGRLGGECAVDHLAGLRCLRLVLLGHGFFNLWGRQRGTRTAAAGKEDSGHDEDPDTWSGPCTVEVFQ